MIWPQLFPICRFKGDRDPPRRALCVCGCGYSLRRFCGHVEIYIGPAWRLDRKGVGSGTSVSVRVVLSGRRIIKKKRDDSMSYGVVMSFILHIEILCMRAF